MVWICENKQVAKRKNIYVLKMTQTREINARIKNKKCRDELNKRQEQMGQKL
jgi:hypothetical protein